jgi:hypothetical protein
LAEHDAEQVATESIKRDGDSAKLESYNNDDEQDQDEEETLEKEAAKG